MVSILAVEQVFNYFWVPDKWQKLVSHIHTYTPYSYMYQQMIITKEMEFDNTVKKRLLFNDASTSVSLGTDVYLVVVSKWSKGEGGICVCTKLMQKMNIWQVEYKSWLLPWQSRRPTTPWCAPQPLLPF